LQFFASSHYPFHGFDVQLCFVGAQRREVCDPLISCVWHVNFGWLSTNNSTWLQGVSSNICNFFDLLSLPISCLWCATLLCQCSARRNADFRSLDTNSLILIGCWCALHWYFYASVGEKIQKEMSFLSALTCVHHPMSLSRTSARRNADFRFLNTDSLNLIGFWCALRWYFYASVGEKIPKRNVPFVCTHIRTWPLVPFA